MFKNGLLFLISILITFLGMEIALHLYPDILPYAVQRNLTWARTKDIHYFSPNFLVRDRELGWYFRPDVEAAVTVRDRIYTVKTVRVRTADRLGFRDDGVEMPVYAMAVGDSFTDGWSIEEEHNWVELLEQEHNADVVNLGTRGWSSIHHKRMVQNYITELQPDVVLWAFFINDLYETGVHLQMLEEQATENFLERAAYAMHNHSAFWELYRYGQQMGPYLPSSTEERLPPYLLEDFDVTLYPKTWENIVDLTDFSVQAGLAATKEYLLETRTLTEANGSQFVLLLFPSAEQVYGPYVQQQTDAADFQMIFGEGNLDYLDRPAELLLEFCGQQQLSCLDLAPGFRAAANKGHTLYINEDQHWNEVGNALAASLIQEYLQMNVK